MTTPGAHVREESPWRAEARAMLSLAWPLILSNVALTLMHSTDVFLLGKIGPSALAAGALATNLVFAFGIFGMGLMTACAPMIATQLGEMPHSVRDVRRTVRQGLWLALLFALPCWAVLWHAEAIYLALGQEPQLAKDAATMISTLKWNIWPFLSIVVLRCFFSAKQNTVWTMVVGFIGVAANAVLNYGLILGKFGFPALGLWGAGLGTTIVNFLMVGLMITVLLVHRDFRRYRLFGNFWRADWQRMRGLISLGAPIALTMGFEVTVFSAATFLMGLFGTTAVAAHSVALQIASLTFMVPLGLAQATTVQVGIGYGRKDPLAMARSGWTGFAMGVGFMSVMAIVMLLIPGSLVGVFVDAGKPENKDVFNIAIGFLAVAALFQVFDGAQVMGAAMLRGLHDTRVPMVFAMIGYWPLGLGVGAALAFGSGLKGLGIWIGLALGLAIVAVLMLIRWTQRDRLGLTQRG